MGKIIQWFIENPIAANALMIIIAIGGLTNIKAINKQVFPGVEVGRVVVTVPYLGAGPLEVEELIVKRVEEAIADLDGIDEISSTSRQGMGTVTVKALNGYDIQQLINNIKTKVDAISTFPSDSERATITEILWRSDIMSIAIYGDVDEAELKSIGEQARDEISLLSGVSLVRLNGTRPDEMSIELSENTLRHYNLSFDQVTNAIRQSSMNIPAGTIQSSEGDIQLQTRAQAYNADDFRRIVVDSREDGSQLKLEDVAIISDGFAEQDVVSRFNGKPAVFLEVMGSESPNVLRSAKALNTYIGEQEKLLPNGVKMVVWKDWSELFKGRMSLLAKNAVGGLILVFIVLMLFLRPALAAWVSVGIAISFLGTFWLLPYFNVSLHMISLFAFLMVLGIVVDDAIIVGESIYSAQQRGMKGNAAAAGGAKMVSRPVLFAVISTMMFFAPMLTTPGVMGDMSYAVPVVVILALFFSLIESLLILPSHLAHLKPEKPTKGSGFVHHLAMTRQKVAGSLTRFADNAYAPALEKLLRHKASTLAGFFIAFALSVALFIGGWVDKSFMPLVASDSVRAQVIMPEGSSRQTMSEVLARLENATQALKQDLSERGHPNVIKDLQVWSQDNEIKLTLAVSGGDERKISTIAISEFWRQMIGPIDEAEDINMTSTINEVSDDILFRVSLGSGNSAHMQAAIDTISKALNRYPGVYDVKSNLSAERTEIELDLKPHAETLGLTLQDIARQVRQGFYGEEAQRIPRGKEDVRVMVRYPLEERSRVDQLDNMRIRTSDSREVSLSSVANITYVPGYTKIERIDRKRTALISAAVEEGTSVPAEVVMDLIERNLSTWQTLYPDLSIGLDGDMEEQDEFAEWAIQGFLLIMMATFGLMAIAFRSVWQPFLILTAIPFGFMGAIIGHMIMGREVSMLSMLGFFACAGVVVNDNLVLLDRINHFRKEGMEVVESVMRAGRDRFRAIVLTSLTTFIGLMPIMAETSLQAKFLIPMVISLAFGVLFATTVTLFLVPTLYISGEKFKARIKARHTEA